MVKVVSEIKSAEILGRHFTVYGTAENPLFLAKDVATWIEYSVGNVSEMLRSVDEDEKCKVFCTLTKLMKPSQSSTYSTSTTTNGGANRWFLTEDGLYEVLMQSQVPIAKQFKKAVKQILKDIRRNGFYATKSTVDNFLEDPDAAIKLLTAYRDEKAKNEFMKRQAMKACNMIADLNNTNIDLAAENYELSAERDALELEYAELEAENTLLTEKLKQSETAINFANAVASTDTLITVSDLAKVLCGKGFNVGGKRLFEWMRQNGYICKVKGCLNSPTQKSMNLGLFKVIPFTFVSATGSKTTYTPKVTQRGVIYFVDKFMKEFPAENADTNSSDEFIPF